MDALHTFQIKRRMIIRIQELDFKRRWNRKLKAYNMELVAPNLFLDGHGELLCRRIIALGIRQVRVFSVIKLSPEIRCSFENLSTE